VRELEEKERFNTEVTEEERKEHREKKPKSTAWNGCATRSSVTDELRKSF
jgi:hypothetical protein